MKQCGLGTGRTIRARAVLDDKYDEIFVSNHVENPIVTLANSVEMV